MIRRFRRALRKPTIPAGISSDLVEKLAAGLRDPNRNSIRADLSSGALRMREASDALPAAEALVTWERWRSSWWVRLAARLLERTR